MTFAEAALIMMSGSAVIESITITRNGTYTAPKGVDGYNPVVVNNPYETLWKLEHGQTEKIDTGLTDEGDEGGKPIIIDGLPVDDIDDVINTGFPGPNVNVTFAALSDSGLVYVQLQYNETVITPDWETQYDISLTVTNAQTGESKTVNKTMKIHGSTQTPVVTLDTAYNISYGVTVYGSGYPTGIHAVIYPSDLGVKGPFKYYICKSTE